MSEGKPVRDFVESVAKKRNWVLQKDQEFLQTVLDGLDANRGTYGYFLCPCREGWGEIKKDRDIICPCQYAEPDIVESGHCYCGLFTSGDYAASGSPPVAIPDRRPEELYPD